MYCRKCNRYIEMSFKWCPNCGKRVILEKIFFIFEVLFILFVIVSGTFFLIVTKQIYMMLLWVIFLSFIFKYVMINYLINYYINAIKPNLKLLFRLYDLKLLNQNNLFTIDYSRSKKGLDSIFNEGEGLVIKCENHCEEKNEIQRNYIRQTKINNLDNEKNKQEKFLAEFNKEEIKKYGHILKRDFKIGDSVTLSDSRLYLIDTDSLELKRIAIAKEKVFINKINFNKYGDIYSYDIVTKRGECFLGFYPIEFEPKID